MTKLAISHCGIQTSAGCSLCCFNCLFCCCCCFLEQHESFQAEFLFLCLQHVCGAGMTISSPSGRSHEFLSCQELHQTDSCKSKATSRIPFSFFFPSFYCHCARASFLQTSENSSGAATLVADRLMCLISGSTAGNFSVVRCLCELDKQLCFVSSCWSDTK